MKRAFALTAALLGAAPLTASDRPAFQTAVLAGGCFWGMEAVFEHVKGVREVVSGYAGGSARDARYDRVSSERTGHAEAIRISYDPGQINYDRLLQIYFSAAHDPTQLNRQGPDEGPSYRSAIFPQDPAQTRAAKAWIDRLTKAKAFPRPIVTRIESGSFYPAEAEHQDFMRRNPRHPYILAHDVPKLARLKKLFPAFYRK
ncbi:peptide-methionine (S)-S-oxide reductase MsrA [Sphingosinicella rhizophila]|uniref:Peptide methionine sulfoxide reductase MsrA n=1 Tax=Sphingosinicella rhizophila TaxID=3050082 RepID=A0ABU3Q7S4_9SPHN|nr:peptide-methionine (S)-S-oxide reductase MsrA [Sphingosinicella sp. GR2756]MDT9599431.1 peptide-methionine (S)-S-oxide reductase MsrA [Sphingosinicella sp. GR2756]